MAKARVAVLISGEGTNLQALIDAVRQLEQTALPEQREALEVLTAESARLEQLAREGR